MNKPALLLNQIIGKAGLFLLKILEDFSPNSQDGKLVLMVKICKVIGAKNRR